LLGAALLSGPAFATDFSEDGNFGGTYSYIGPGVASLPDVDVDVGPLGAGVYVEPGVAFMSPAMDYAVPASTWAPVYPQAQLDVVPPDATGATSKSVPPRWASIQGNSQREFICVWRGRPRRALLPSPPR
jgi:hypothetical protein